MHLGMVGEAEESLSEDLDHRALVMDITQAAESESDHLAQELRNKLETSDPPMGWEVSEGQLWFQGCLYIPDQEILCLQVIRNHHDHQQQDTSEKQGHLNSSTIASTGWAYDKW